MRDVGAHLGVNGAVEMFATEHHAAFRPAGEHTAGGNIDNPHLTVTEKAISGRIAFQAFPLLVLTMRAQIVLGPAKRLAVDLHSRRDVVDAADAALAVAHDAPAFLASSRRLAARVHDPINWRAAPDEAVPRTPA